MKIMILFDESYWFCLIKVNDFVWMKKICSLCTHEFISGFAFIENCYDVVF